MMVMLGRDERDALISLAQIELRMPRDQLRHILRQELCRRGLLPESDGTQSETNQISSSLPDEDEKARTDR